MHARAAAAMACLALLSGCLDSNEAPADAAPSAPAWDPWHGVEEFHWESAFGGDTALEVAFEFWEGADCDLDLAAQTETSTYGPIDQVLLEEDGLVTGWAGGGHYPAAHVHAGGIDTRSGGGGSGGGGSGFGGTFDGLLHVTMLMPGASHASIDLECDGPFDVIGAQVGSGLVLVDQYNLDGGTGATASYMASVNLGDSASLDVQGPRGRAAFGAIGYQVGSIALTTPEGRQSYDLGPGFGYVAALLEAGPGTYRIDVERVSADFDILWAGLWSLDGDFPLAPGLRIEGYED